MLSKAVIKYIKSLQVKKYRTLHQAFVVEGAKSVSELLASGFEIEQLFITEEFFRKHTEIPAKGYDYTIVTENQLTQAGTYESNNAALAIARTKTLPPLQLTPQDFALVLDDVRDPGNLGTIIRIADWYGLKKIICSEHTADFYNPKVIAATMGSFARVSAYYLNLPEFLSKLGTDFKIYGAALNGKNIHKENFKNEGLVIMGNEANGISAEVMQYVTQPITIPGFGKAESLNVATATAIITDNFFRNIG